MLTKLFGHKIPSPVTSGNENGRIEQSGKCLGYDCFILQPLVFNFIWKRLTFIGMRRWDETLNTVGCEKNRRRGWEVVPPLFVKTAAFHQFITGNSKNRDNFIYLFHLFFNILTTLSPASFGRGNCL